MKQNALLFFVLFFLAVLSAVAIKQGYQNHFEHFEGTDGVRYAMPPSTYFAILSSPADMPDGIPEDYETKAASGQRAVVDKMGQLFYDGAFCGTLAKGDEVRVEDGQIFVNGQERHPEQVPRL